MKEFLFNKTNAVDIVHLDGTFDDYEIKEDKVTDGLIFSNLYRKYTINKSNLLMFKKKYSKDVEDIKWSTVYEPFDAATIIYPQPLEFIGFRKLTLIYDGGFSLTQSRSGYVDGTITLLNDLSKSMYLEFNMSGSNLAITIGATTHLTLANNGIGFTYVSGLISIFYNAATKKATILLNGKNAKTIDVTTPNLGIFFGSGTVSSGSFKYINPTNHNKIYFEEAKKLTL